MRTDTQPHGLGHGVDVVDPVRGRLRYPHLGHDRRDDEFLEALLVWYVVVDRHRTGAQRGGKCTHAQRADPGIVDDAECRGGDLVGGEPCTQFPTPYALFARALIGLDKYVVREAA